MDGAVSTDFAFRARVRADLGRPVKLAARGLNVHFDSKHVLIDVDLDIRANQVTGIMGPSGCGKSTFLKCINRSLDSVRGCRVDGELKVDDRDILAIDTDLRLLRRHVGIVSQRPNPFPTSIHENIGYGLRIHRLVSDKASLDAAVEDSLKKVGLWDEVKDRLKAAGTALSGGQQQRLCIARAMALKPDILLMDEPCSSVDPIATAQIEALILELAETTTILLVTHNIPQAARLAADCAYFHAGRMLEAGPAEKVFGAPERKETRAFLKGRFG